MKSRLERFLTRVWYRDDSPPAWLRALVPLYRALAGSRWHRPDTRPAVPVVVVGNITVGGSGKTPVVAALARALARTGSVPAIISRGYGGRRQQSARAVTPASDPHEVGDEPVMLARRAGCPVWVCADRTVALDAAIRAGADVVLSDDGLQHPRLPRSYELCVIDGLRGLGNGWLLPAGPLRQPIEGLQRVDQVLVKLAGDGGMPRLPVEAAGFSVVPGRPYRLGQEGEAMAVPDAEFDAVCAIGNPLSFFRLLEAEGYRFRPRPFPDHHAFHPGDLEDLDGPLIVTEKDAVKLERLKGLPETWVLPIEAALAEGCVEAVEQHVREFSAT